MRVTTASSVSSVIRTSLFVRDLDAATAFYHALGLTEVYYEGRLTGEQTAPIAVPDTSVIRCRILKREGMPNYGMRGLFEVRGPELEALPPAAGPPRVGEASMVFYVADMAGTMRALRAAGATWAPDPVIFRMPHLEQQEACVRDVDGVLINLIESHPDRQHVLAPEPHEPLPPRG